MPKSNRRRDLMAVFFLALVVNGLAASFISRPGYMDAYYYFGGALQLARGKGFTEPYLWNYLQPAPIGALPEAGGAEGEREFPSHLYWMPLTSIVAAPFVALAGTNSPTSTLFRAAQIPFILLASLLPLLTYLIATSTTGLRRHALAAALLTVFSGFYVLFWANTDSFALYSLTAGGSLYLIALARQRASRRDASRSRSARWFFVAGLCIGLAHLTRADGLFLLFVAWVIILSAAPTYGVRPTQSLSRTAFRPVPLGSTPWGLLFTNYFLPVTLGYLLVMFPWLLRNLLAVGAPLAPGGDRVLWLTEYNDLFSYPADTLTLARYLSAGWGSLLAGKWWALKTNLGRLIGEQGLVAASPFIAAGLWRLRREPLYGPALLYFLVLFGLMTFVFTFPGPRGGLFHSGAALLPFFFPAALVGLDASIEAGARLQGRVVHALRLAARFSLDLSRLFPPWQPEKSKPVFTALLVLFAAVLTTVLFVTRLIDADRERPSGREASLRDREARNPKSARTDQVYAEIGGWLAEMGDRQSLVVVNDPPGFYYFTGHASLIVPNGGPEVLLRVVSDFGARWVVLDANYPAGLETLYRSPTAEPRLALRAAFADDNDRPVYLFERRAIP